MTELHAIGKFFDQLGVAAAEHDIVGNQGKFQLLQHLVHFLLPVFLAEPLKAFLPDLVFNDSIVDVRQIAELER